MGADDFAGQSHHLLRPVRPVEGHGQKERHFPAAAHETHHSTEPTESQPSRPIHPFVRNSGADPRPRPRDQQVQSHQGHEQAAAHVARQVGNATKPTLHHFPLHQDSLLAQRSPTILLASHFPRRRLPNARMGNHPPLVDKEPVVDQSSFPASNVSIT